MSRALLATLVATAALSTGCAADAPVTVPVPAPSTEASVYVDDAKKDQSSKPSTSAAPLPSGTPGQEAAVAAAVEELHDPALSPLGLRLSLRVGGHAEPDVTWAVQNIEHDWVKQAVGTARYYLDAKTDLNERDEIIEQLVWDGYTRDMATRAANRLGL